MVPVVVTRQERAFRIAYSIRSSSPTCATRSAGVRCLGRDVHHHQMPAAIANPHTIATAFRRLGTYSRMLNIASCLYHGDTENAENTDGVSLCDSVSLC